MPPSNARKPGGFAALYEVQERLRREREERAREKDEPQPQPAAQPKPHSVPAPEKLRDIEPQKPAEEHTSQLTESSQLAESSQLPQSSQPAASRLGASSQLAEEADGSSPSWQFAGSSQLGESHQPLSLPSPSVNLIAGLPQAKGHLRLPNQVVDHLLPQLDPFEQAVYIQLYRLSWGFNKPTCSISLPKLVERSRIPLSTLKKVISRLQGKGLIEKTSVLLGYGKEQGIEYRVLAPSSQPAESSQLVQSSQLAGNPNKEIKNINTHTHRAEPKDDKETAVGVGVKSKFSIEDCRRYADHLHRTGQGITNPGGYAMTIHRTGEADPLIESFLNPPPAAAPAQQSQIDVSRCPDCRGTGYWYPKGPEHGVARCKHERLTTEGSEA